MTAWNLNAELVSMFCAGCIAVAVLGTVALVFLLPRRDLVWPDPAVQRVRDAAPELLAAVDVLCKSLVNSMERHPGALSLKDREALADACALLARVRRGRR